MKHTAGIWIDHQRAVIVSWPRGRATTTTVASEVGAHPHFGGQQDGGGEKRYEERHGHRLDRFYDEVIGHLQAPVALLIFGPGEAKLELKARLSRSKPLSDCRVDVETADTLTEPQIVERARAHFDIAG